MAVGRAAPGAGRGGWRPAARVDQNEPLSGAHMYQPSGELAARLRDPMPAEHHAGWADICAGAFTRAGPQERRMDNTAAWMAANAAALGVRGRRLAVTAQNVSADNVLAKIIPCLGNSS